MFNGDWQDGEAVWHHCGNGCACTSEGNAKENMVKAWDRVVVHRKLSVASVTRWTKYQRPLKQVAVACCVHSLMQRAWKQLSGSIKASENLDGAGPLQVDIAAMPDEQDQQRLKKARVNKADLWLSRPEIVKQLLLCQICVNEVNPLVRQIFLDSQDDFIGNSAGFVPPLYNLASAENSLPLKVIDNIVGSLQPDSMHWTALRLTCGSWGLSCEKRSKRPLFD